MYEKQQLISSFTDQAGNFSIRLKTKYPDAQLSISKDGFHDTAFVLQPKYDQKLSIALTALRVQTPEPAWVVTQHTDSVQDVNIHKEPENYDMIEQKWLGKVLLSSKQKIQSLNLKKFYTTRAYQFSVVPGIGTHGKMNSRVINNTSINLLGGYSGGVNSFEIGGLFNMVQGDVSCAQIGGLFNLVGGSAKGFQIGGLYNDVNHSVDGIQIGGLANRVFKKVKGFQIASLVNLVGSLDGTQIGGLMNVVRNEMKGTQLSALYNHAGEVRGVQIGLINHTSSYTGTSVGLINISKSKKGRTRVGFLLRVPHA